MCWRPYRSGSTRTRMLCANVASALTLRAKVPNLDVPKFDEMARDAEKNCPVSKVLNAEITFDAKLI
jgi:organic hydroperoxide reductase OsmC/OhrA